MRSAIIENGAFLREAPDVNTVWDDTHYCTPSHLTKQEANKFNVVEVESTMRPSFDSITQTVVEQQPIKENGKWKQVWSVQSLDSETIAANQAAKQYMIDAEVVRSDAKLKALRTMTPAALKTWVSNNVTNLTQAQDAIATLAIAVGILSRRI